ncbi:MAG: NAD-dependent epimerase/dehydratase family protein [Leptospira sp.]|nr:NAD-dependent epimerase/dehydratase family protein [Leptospira sp.]
MKDDKPNIYLTGASGFVGSFLRDSNFSKIYNLISINRNELNSYTSSNHSVKKLIHLAGFAHQDSNRYEDYEKANVIYTQKILDLSVELGIEHFIYFSSIKALGEGRDEPYNELSVPKPIDFYGKTKLIAEDLVKTFTYKNNQSYTILRPPLLYGNYPKANMLSLVRWIQSQKPVPLSTKSNQRSILSLENLESFLQTIITNTRSHNQTFLLQDPQPLSTEELAKLIGKSLGVRNYFLRIPHFLGSTLSRVTGQSGKWERLSNSLYVDDSYTREVLNWKPPQSTRECIQNMVNSLFNK